MRRSNIDSIMEKTYIKYTPHRREMITGSGMVICSVPTPSSGTGTLDLMMAGDYNESEIWDDPDTVIDRTCHEDQ